MPFQTGVTIYSGVGQVGHPASASPIVAYAGGPGAFVSDADGITIATFVFRTEPGSKVVTNKAPTADAVPLGFIQNLGQAVIYSRENQSMKVAGGVEASPKVAGDFWAVSKTVAVDGQKVFASVTDGTISTGDEGATVAGHVETSYSVSYGAPVGDLIIISSWSK